MATENISNDIANNRQTVTVTECSQILGIARGKCYEACRTGRIPNLRFGKRIVIPKAALKKMLLIDGESFDETASS